jgi:hypothetical protein
MSTHENMSYRLPIINIDPVPHFITIDDAHRKNMVRAAKLLIWMGVTAVFIIIRPLALIMTVYAYVVCETAAFPTWLADKHPFVLTFITIVTPYLLLAALITLVVYGVTRKFQRWNH